MTKQMPHINEKIIEEMQDILKDDYEIHIDADWDLFKEPLIRDDDGKINKAAFNERQEKSIDIINKILDVNGKSKIVKFLGKLAKIEPKIQELQPWVRDHVVHALNTFILGVYIIKKVDFPKLEGACFDYPFMWKLCGPTHDLGYPIEIAHNIKRPFAIEMNNILDRLDSPSPTVELELFPKNLDKLCEEPDANTIIQNRLNDWELGINIEHFYDWLKMKNKTDHGVVGALAQLKVIDALYYDVNHNRGSKTIYPNNLIFNPDIFDKDIVNACSALFIHNIDIDYDGFSNKISFDTAPLAFLLFLCDTFQEYDRYSEKNSNKNRCDTNCDTGELEYDKNQMKKNVHSGNYFNIICNLDSISLFVPEYLESEMCEKLSKRLSGLKVKVNGKDAVFE